MTMSTWKVYIVQVRTIYTYLFTRRVHARAVSVLLKICTIPNLLCVHSVSTEYDYDTYTASLDTIQEHYHTRLVVCRCSACFAENILMMYQQFPRTFYVSPYGLCVSFALLSGVHFL